MVEPLRRISSSTSRPLKRVEVGMSTAPAETRPRAATNQRQLFGAQIMTRSPFFTPHAIIAFAARRLSRSSSAKVSRVAPSSMAVASPYVSAARAERAGMVVNCQPESWMFFMSTRADAFAAEPPLQ